MSHPLNININPSALADFVRLVDDGVIPPITRAVCSHPLVGLGKGGMTKADPARDTIYNHNEAWSELWTMAYYNRPIYLADIARTWNWTPEYALIFIKALAANDLIEFEHKKKTGKLKITSFRVPE